MPSFARSCRLHTGSVAAPTRGVRFEHGGQAVGGTRVYVGMRVTATGGVCSKAARVHGGGPQHGTYTGYEAHMCSYAVHGAVDLSVNGKRTRV